MSPTDDVEFHGQTVPAGSALLMMLASANRDERHFDDPDRFDIHRKPGGHLTFGHGAHFCLGRRWPAWRAASRSRRYSSGGPMGRRHGGGAPVAHLDGARLGHHARGRRLT